MKLENVYVCRYRYKNNKPGSWLKEKWQIKWHSKSSNLIIDLWFVSNSNILYQQLVSCICIFQTITQISCRYYLNQIKYLSHVEVPKQTYSLQIFILIHFVSYVSFISLIAVKNVRMFTMLWTLINPIKIMFAFGKKFDPLIGSEGHQA